MAVANTYLNDQLEARLSGAPVDGLGSARDIRAAHPRLRDRGADRKLKAENGLSDTGAQRQRQPQQTSDINGQLVPRTCRCGGEACPLRADQACRGGERGLQSIPEVMASSVISQLRGRKPRSAARRWSCAAASASAIPSTSMPTRS